MFSTEMMASRCLTLNDLSALKSTWVWPVSCLLKDMEMVVSSIFRDYVTPGGRKWLPLASVLGSIAIVAYADYIATTVSLGYLYILPLGIAALFLRSQISYGLVAVCLFLHDLFRPKHVIAMPLRLAHNVTALVSFVLVVYAVQRYVMQRELLAKAVREQRDDLLNDVQLAGQV